MEANNIKSKLAFSGQSGFLQCGFLCIFHKSPKRGGITAKVEQKAPQEASKSGSGASESQYYDSQQNGASVFIRTRGSASCFCLASQLYPVTIAYKCPASSLAGMKKYIELLHFSGDKINYDLWRS